MQNRRKTVVINKKFQPHYALMFVAATVVLTNLLIIVRVLFPGAEPVNFTLGMSLTIGAIELLLIGSVWYGSLRMTHHIAGPVFVINRQIKNFADGDYSSRIRLRQGDAFQEEVAEINASLEKLERALEELQKGSAA